MAKKRLVVCCDGTWNTPDEVRDGKPCQTNVTKIARAVVIPQATQGIEQRMYYHKGVGTGTFDHFRGGALGWGLSRNVQDAYMFFVENYDDPDDEIFLFGFSRGAYTARSVAGLLRNAGLLKREYARKLDAAYELYRDRTDCENSFDELKNHWGWGGFTTHDLTRCRIMARIVALIFNWWNLFVRLADPDHHREAITSRPLLLQAIGRQTNHAGRATVTITSSHGERDRARRALTRIAAFFATLRETAKQLTDLDRWYRILSRALVKYLKGRQLNPPRRLQAA